MRMAKGFLQLNMPRTLLPSFDYTSLAVVAPQVLIYFLRTSKTKSRAGVGDWGPKVSLWWQSLIALSHKSHAYNCARFNMLL